MSAKANLFGDLLKRASSVPLSEILPGVIRLAKSFGEDDLLQWARLELDGYFSRDEPMKDDRHITIPSYRFITGQFSDQWGRPLLLGTQLSFVNQYPLRFGVAILEQMASRHEAIRVRDEDSVELLREHLGVEATIFAFSPMVVAGILSGIRTHLIEALAELEAKHPELHRPESENVAAQQNDSAKGQLMTFSKNIQRLTAVASGIAFLITILALAIAVPNPTPFQYAVFRIVLALAAAAFAATIPGFLEVTISGIARATGAIAVFLIVYFFSPAKLLTNDPNREISLGSPKGVQIDPGSSAIPAPLSADA